MRQIGIQSEEYYLSGTDAPVHECVRVAHSSELEEGGSFNEPRCSWPDE